VPIEQEAARIVADAGAEGQRTGCLPLILKKHRPQNRPRSTGEFERPIAIELHGRVGEAGVFRLVFIGHGELKGFVQREPLDLDTALHQVAAPLARHRRDRAGPNQAAVCSGD
jgi:hypothetical protein